MFSSAGVGGRCSPALCGAERMPFSPLPPVGHDDLARPGNIILAAVPAQEYDDFRGLLEVCTLEMGETLLEAGEQPDYVYFPTGGVISVVTALENGMRVEFASVGREGSTGVPLFLDMDNASMALVASACGSSLRMRTGDFLGAIERSPSLAAIVRRYTGTLLAFAAQMAACNSGHDVEQRCARRLLLTYDRAGDGAFPLTQEFLAQLLGVSRPSVGLAAAALQKAGLITYHRGEMSIIDRRGLENASCECYRIIREHFRRLWDQLVLEDLTHG